MANSYANLFQPIKIGKVEIKNRFMLAPMGPGGLCDADGSFNYRGVEFYVERARRSRHDHDGRDDGGKRD